MSLSSDSERKRLLGRGDKTYSDEKSDDKSVSTRPLTQNISTERVTTATTKESLTSKDSKESQDKSKEAVDEVSIEGPKKSDGSEFKKGPKGWTMSFIYLGILWLFGFLFTASIMYLLLLQLQERPHYFGKGSHIGGTPGLIYEPNPNRFDVGTRGVIRFGSGDPRSYHNHMIRYRKLLSGEYNNTNTSIPKCAVVIGAVDGAPTNESVCDVEPGSPQLYGPCVLTMQNINRGMGFSNGEPCIMLRLTRMLGWFPSDYVDSKERKCHGHTTNCCKRKRLQFTCEAVKGSASLEMLPKDGISICAFPFWNQKGYQQPFVMLKVANLQPGKNEIKCRPSQKSLQYFDDGHENIIRIFIEKLD